MPTYKPQLNSLLQNLGIEPSADPTMMASPLGMAAGGGQMLSGLKGVARLQELIRRSMHHKKMLESIGPNVLNSPIPRAMTRPASPPTFTPSEIDKMQGVISRWLAMPKKN